MNPEIDCLANRVAASENATRSAPSGGDTVRLADGRTGTIAGYIQSGGTKALVDLPGGQRVVVAADTVKPA